jgi:hypothetical protein
MEWVTLTINHTFPAGTFLGFFRVAILEAFCAATRIPSISLHLQSLHL